MFHSNSGAPFYTADRITDSNLERGNNCTFVIILQKFKSSRKDIKEESFPYVESCLELCWYSAINDPRIDYVFEANTQPEDFRTYTQSGKDVDFVVWPAMYLYENGPVLYKGVAQFSN